MKTKEEIEQLAFLKYPRVINDPYNPMEDDNTYERKIWIGAYSQCQEDMDDEILDELEKFAIEYEKSMADKRYTEEDIRKAILYGQTTKNIDYHNDFINSLNKQD